MNIDAFKQLTWIIIHLIEPESGTYGISNTGSISLIVTEIAGHATIQTLKNNRNNNNIIRYKHHRPGEVSVIH